MCVICCALGKFLLRIYSCMRLKIKRGQHKLCAIRNAWIRIYKNAVVKRIFSGKKTVAKSLYLPINFQQLQLLSKNYYLIVEYEFTCSMFYSVRGVGILQICDKTENIWVILPETLY